MLGPPRMHDFDPAVIALEREAGIQHVLARLDVGEHRGVVRGESGGAVESLINLRQETGTYRHVVLRKRDYRGVVTGRSDRPLPGIVRTPSRRAKRPLTITALMPTAYWNGFSKVARSATVSGSNITMSAA